MPAKWKKNAEPQHLFAYINKSRHVDENDQVRLKGFTIDYCRPALSAMIEVSDKITDDDRHEIFNSTLWNRITSGDLEPNTFLEEFDKQYRSHLGIPKKRYQLRTSISMYPEISIPKMKEAGCVFVWQRGSARLEKERKRVIGNRDEACDFDDSLYTPVRVFVQARTVHKAMHDGLEALDYIRGLLNVATVPPIRITKAGTSRPANTFVLGPNHTIHNNRGACETDMFWYDTQYRSMLSSYKDTPAWTKVIEYVLRLRKKVIRNSKSKQIIRAVVGYCRALDEWDHTSAFIQLWSVLELLTGSPRQYDVVVRRALFCYKDLDHNKQMLEHLRDVRNRYVHRRESSVEMQSNMFMLADYVRTLIRFYIFHGNRFERLQDIHELMDTPKEAGALNKKAAMIDFTRRYRRV